MTQQELDALQGLCDGATAGEWCAVDKGNTVPSHMVVMRAIGANPISIASAISPRTGNAAFIAAARTALPALIAEVRRLQAELHCRKLAILTPIYTSGGHGYEDDDDEDFWCPVCCAHLGTHHGYKTECPRCGQTINSDGEPIYKYRDMLRAEEEWRGPQPTKEVTPDA